MWLDVNFPFRRQVLIKEIKDVSFACGQWLAELLELVNWWRYESFHVLANPNLAVKFFRATVLPHNIRMPNVLSCKLLFRCRNDAQGKLTRQG